MLPMHDSGFQLVVKVPEEKTNFYKIFAPFQSDLWMVVGLEVLMVAVSVFLIEHPRFSICEEYGVKSDFEEGLVAGFIDCIYYAKSAHSRSLLPL